MQHLIPSCPSLPGVKRRVSKTEIPKTELTLFNYKLAIRQTVNAQFLPKTLNTTATNHNISMPKVDDLRAVLPFVAASGKVWMLVLIFAGKEDRKFKSVYFRNEDGNSHGSFPILYATTSSGYITGELWLDIIDRFIKELETHRGKRTAILFTKAWLH